MNEKNIDGQGQGETKIEKITINTTQMPGPFGEMFSSVMSTMTNGGSFDLLQQQAQHQKQRQETNAEEEEEEDWARRTIFFHLYYTHCCHITFLYVLFLSFLKVYDGCWGKSSFF